MKKNEHPKFITNQIVYFMKDNEIYTGRIVRIFIEGIMNLGDNSPSFKYQYTVVNKNVDYWNDCTVGETHFKEEELFSSSKELLESLNSKTIKQL